MVRSDSADEEINIEKYDDLEECIEDEYPPQPRWQHANAGNRPHSRATSSLSPTASDPDRRLRRQIANCNERRRMQSINAGFQSLRALLPRKEGEKLSKAAILQQTADLIHTMPAERQRLLDSEGAGGKKAKLDSDYNDIEQRAMIDRLQVALERERSSRMFLEQQVNQLREQLCYQAQFSPASPPSVPPSAAAAAVQQQQQQRQVGVVSPQQPPPHQQSPPLVGQGGHQEVASVIRPTPLPPISVDVTQRCTNPTSLTSSPLTMSAAAAAPALVSSAPSAFTQSSSTAAHRSLQTILDAIRHLEGGHVLAAHSPPPTSQATVVR